MAPSRISHLHSRAACVGLSLLGFKADELHQLTWRQSDVESPEERCKHALPCAYSRLLERACSVCAGLSLLGFKPVSCLKPWHTWRQSNFVYPDERTMPGSTTAFIALHEAMLSQDRLALCAYVRSRATEPRLVSLIAAQEVRDEYGDQVGHCSAFCAGNVGGIPSDAVLLGDS